MMRKEEVRGERRLVLLVFVIALVLRLAYAFYLLKHYPFHDHPGDDVLYYQQWARDIASGNWIGHRVFYGMPLYPYFLAVLTKLSLGHFSFVRLAHLLLGSLNAVLVYFVAARVFSKRVAILASLLTATNFLLIYYDWLMMPVTLIVSLGLLAALMLLHLEVSSRADKWLALGLLLGLGMLADGKFAIALALVIGYLVQTHRGDVLHLAKKALLPLAGGVFLVLLVVAARNRVVGGDWVLVSAHDGINFYIGNSQGANGVFANPPFLRPNHYGHEEDPGIIAQQRLKKVLTPSEVSRYWFREGLSFISDSPVQFVNLTGKKFRLFFTDSNVASDVDLLLQDDLKSRLDLNSLRVIVPLAILGAAMTVRCHSGTFVPGAFILSQLLFSLTFFLITRHRATILPFALIFEASGVLWLSDKLRAKEFRHAIAGGLAAGLLFFMLRPVSVSPNEISFLRHSRAGFMYGERKDFRKSEEQYLKALAFEPLSPTILYNLGNLCLNDGRYAQAQKYYERAISVRPDDANTVYNLALSYERGGNLQQAANGYLRVLQLQPEARDARSRLGSVYLRLGRIQEAQQVMR